MRYDAIVIGAGMSGLAAAIRLALHDRRVVVLERHDVWGGLNSFYTLGGRRFDVGLHALTNWAPPRARGAPLSRLLRQLRIRHEELRLGQQGFSEILLPGLRLTFTNAFEHFEAQVAAAFPAERDGFAALVAAVRAHALDEEDDEGPLARGVLARFVRDPLLVDALCLPCCFYGSALEDDVSWRQFVVLFRSVFLEGLARPAGGIRTLLNLLVKRCKAAGAELRTRAGVRRIVVEGGAARGVVLDDGSELAADCILSSAGLLETRALVDGAPPRAAEAGRLSFLETISVLDRPPAALGHGAATSFFSLAAPFRYRRPEGLVDTESGVLSAPTNFATEEPELEPALRLTVLANHERFAALDPAAYAAAKEDAAGRALARAATLFPDWRPATVFRDVFTPCTIRRFTGHAEGAVYGAPRKRPSGATGVPGLWLCGTDQGWLGVVGALVSGVAMANRHALSLALEGER